jgi:hypothetical protein
MLFLIVGVAVATPVTAPPNWGLTEDRRLRGSPVFPQRAGPAFFRRLRLCIAKQKSRPRASSTVFQP